MHIIGGDATVRTEEGRKWEMIRLVILGYTKKYPDVWAAFIKQQNLKRKDLKDPVFGTSGDKNSSLRPVCEVPSDLDITLKKIDKYYDKGDSLKEFLKRFPVFQLPDKY